MEHTAVNGSVHTGCKQHQRVCMQICKFARKSACASRVNGAKGPGINAAAFWPGVSGSDHMAQFWTPCFSAQMLQFLVLCAQTPLCFLHNFSGISCSASAWRQNRINTQCEGGMYSITVQQPGCASFCNKDPKNLQVEVQVIALQTPVSGNLSLCRISSFLSVLLSCGRDWWEKVCCYVCLATKETCVVAMGDDSITTHDVLLLVVPMRIQCQKRTVMWQSGQRPVAMFAWQPKRRAWLLWVMIPRCYPVVYGSQKYGTQCQNKNCGEDVVNYRLLCMLSHHRDERGC